MAESHVLCWFWALSSWEFFLAKRTYHQVIPAFKVPRDLPRELSCSAMILDDLDYGTSSFEGFVMKEINFVT